ncbi:1072_t:CDS:2, partial [Diversispora eburnea]
IAKLRKKFVEVETENIEIRIRNAKVKIENIEIKVKNTKLKQILKEYETRFMKLECDVSLIKEQNTQGIDINNSITPITPKQIISQSVDILASDTPNITNFGISLSLIDIYQKLETHVKPKLLNDIEIRQKNRNKKLQCELPNQKVHSIFQNTVSTTFCETGLNSVIPQLSPDNGDIISLYKNTYDVEADAIEANREEISHWCFYAKEFKNSELSEASVNTSTGIEISDIKTNVNKPYSLITALSDDESENFFNDNIMSTMHFDDIRYTNYQRNNKIEDIDFTYSENE